MFGRYNIEKIIKERDLKKLTGAVRKDPDVAANFVRTNNWNVLAMLLDASSGYAVDAIISQGNLTLLKQAIETKPDILKSFYTIKGKYTAGSILHIAAKYDQAAIIEFLVKEKDMKVDKLQKNMWTPLHFAVKNDAQEAMKKLMDLGANPDLQAGRRTAYDLCANIGTKELLQDYRKELLNKSKTPATTPVEAPVHAAVPSTHVVTIEFQAGRFRLTDIFNFESETWTRVTENRDNGQTIPETKTFDEAGPKLVELARSKLSSTTPPTEKAPSLKLIRQDSF